MLTLVENAEPTEYKKLKSEINQLKRQIQATKENIFRMYTLKRKSEALASKSDDESPPCTSKSSDLQLTEAFYNQIMQVKCKEDGSLITVLFNTNGNFNFGLNLVKTVHEKWSLEKYRLPPSVDIDHFKKEISQLSLLQIPEYLNQIQNNIDTYNIRERFINQLKEIMDPRIRLYHCSWYTELEFTFKVFNKETKVRKSLTVELNFGLPSAIAVQATCKINGNEEDEEMREFLNQHFQIFTELDIIRAYKEAFKNVDKYEFLV